MTAPAGGGFVFDTNALHTAETLGGGANRDVVILEVRRCHLWLAMPRAACHADAPHNAWQFHPHGKIPFMGPKRFVTNPCPSYGGSNARQSNNSLLGVRGFPLYPPEQPPDGSFEWV